MSSFEKITLALFCGITLVSTILPADVYAASKKKPKAAQVTKLAIKADKAIDELAKLFALLSAEDKAKVAARLARSSYADSDGDGVADVIDEGANRCDTDSDDDGKPDGDELKDGDDPDDSDSDDDGNMDGSWREVRAHGAVSSQSGVNFTINGVEFLIADATVFKDNLSASDIVVEACLAVKAYKDEADGVAIAEKIEQEDGCK